MPVLITTLEVNKVFIGKYGLKRKILEIKTNSVRFLVTDIGTKPPVRFKLMQEYEVNIQDFARWAESETLQ